MSRKRQQSIDLDRIVDSIERGPLAIQLPNIELPNIQLPEIQVPDIPFPKIPLPDLKPPRFLFADNRDLVATAERAMSSVAHSISEQALAAVQAAHESIRRQFDALQVSLGVFDRSLLAYEEKARDLGTCGWTLPLLLPVANLPDLLEGIEPGTDYDAAFEDYYLSNDGRAAHQLFADLSDNPRMKMWKPLLSECIEAYWEEKFRIIVPSLFLVLDGALASASNALLRKTDAKNLSASKRRNSQRVIETLAWASLEGFTNELFGSHHFGGPRPARTNRHWVLHGRDVPEWTHIDGLRLFQALHSIPA